MKLLLASVIAVAFAASPAYAQQPADKDADKVRDKAESVETSPKSTDTVVTAVSSEAAIAPEVLEVVNKKKRYTTSDLVKAQLDALNRTPSPAG